MAPAVSAWEQLIVDFLRTHGPIERDSALRSRGTADILTMVGCGYPGRLGDFRRHLRRAAQIGLIHGDLFNFLAAGPEDSLPQSLPQANRAAAQVIDLTEPKTAMTTTEGSDAGLLVAPGAAALVEAIINFDRSDEALSLLAERGLSYGTLLDFSIEIDRERPSPTADPRAGPATRRAAEALWIRGFGSADIAEVLNLSERLADALCEPLSRGEKVREIVELHLAGMPASDIANAKGLGIDAVKRALRRFGFVPRRRQRLVRDDKDRPDHRVKWAWDPPSSGA